MSDLTEAIKSKEEQISEVDVSMHGLQPWSYSKLKVFQQCPLRFYIQYILKVKGKPIEVGLSTNVGKAVHRILELLVMGKSITDSFKQARKSYEDVITSEQWEENVSTLEMNIMQFRERL